MTKTKYINHKGIECSNKTKKTVFTHYINEEEKVIDDGTTGNEGYDISFYPEDYETVMHLYTVPDICANGVSVFVAVDEGLKYLFFGDIGDEFNH